MSTFRQAFLAYLAVKTEFANISDPYRVLLLADPENTWSTVLPELKNSYPGGVYTLGPYDPATNTGPALWLKVTILNQLEQTGKPPLLCLPGVSYSDLFNANNNYPNTERDSIFYLGPIKEYLYTGAWLGFSAGEALSVATFLKEKKHGLGIDLGRDQATMSALRLAAGSLLDVPVAHLPGHLRGLDLYELMFGNVSVSVLEWLDAPNAVVKAHPEAFKQLLLDCFDIELERQGHAKALDRFVKKTGVWKPVWDTYAHKPSEYSGLNQLLATIESDDPDLPKGNAKAEAALRMELGTLTNLTIEEVINRLSILEIQHGKRCNSVLASMGDTIMANVLRVLIKLFTDLAKPYKTGSIAELESEYVTRLWEIDEGVQQLYRLVPVNKESDREVIDGIVKAFYEPYLYKLAERLQALVSNNYQDYGRPIVPASTHYLFIDALRYDLCKELQALLISRGMIADIGHTRSALPSLTSTAKPAVSPIASLVSTESLHEEFAPSLAAGAETLNSNRFTSLMQKQGFTVASIKDKEQYGKAWYQTSDLDKLGHHESADFALDAERLLTTLADQIQSILPKTNGTLVIVTDHGWLWMPTTLPKKESHKGLTEDQWGRVSYAKQGARTGLLEVPWTWNKLESHCYAPGISVFKNGMHYTHGGISPQECFIPYLVVKATTQTEAVKIIDLKWMTEFYGDVSLSGVQTGLKIDLRTDALDSTTSVAEKLESVKKTQCPIFVKEGYQGVAVEVVLLSEDGTVLHRYPTTTPEDK